MGVVAAFFPDSSSRLDDLYCHLVWDNSFRVVPVDLENKQCPSVEIVFLSGADSRSLLSCFELAGYIHAECMKVEATLPHLLPVWHGK